MKRRRSDAVGPRDQRLQPPGAAMPEVIGVILGATIALALLAAAWHHWGWAT